MNEIKLERDIASIEINCHHQFQVNFKKFKKAFNKISQDCYYKLKLSNCYSNVQTK